MKSIFDSNSNELKTAINGVIDDIGDGAFSVAFIEAMAAAQISPSDDMATILGKLAAFFTAAQTAITTVQIDAGHPNRYLSADGTYKTPDAGEASNGLPDGGTAGQMLVKSTDDDYDAEWDTVTASTVGAIPTSAKGAANGVSSLDANGKVTASQASASVVNHGNDQLTFTVSNADFGKLHTVSVTSEAQLGNDIEIGAEVEFLAKGSAVLTISCDVGDEFIMSAGAGAPIASSGMNALIVIKKVAAGKYLAKGDIA